MSAARAAAMAMTMTTMLAACGDDPRPPAEVDAAADQDQDAGADGPPRPPDPFAGMYDSPDDFPRTGCRAGALAGFARAELWPELGVRSAVEGGALVTYVSDSARADVVAPHVLTADDLLVRDSAFVESTGRWSLRVADACDVLPDGTLIGHRVVCVERATGPSCDPVRAFTAEPLHRIAGEAEAAGGLALVGELAVEGRSVNVRVADGVAYLPMGSLGMRTVSVADPAAPQKLGWWLPAEPNYYNDVKLMTVGGRRLAVLAGRPSDIVDVTDPAAPFLVARLPSSAHTVAVEGPLAYFVGSTVDLRIYDLSTPSAPVLRRELTLSLGSTHDLTVVDGFAYISSPYVGLAIVDVRDPDNPIEVTRASQDPARYWHSPWLTVAGGRRIAVHGDEGLGGKLAILDLDEASPTYLQEIGAWTPRELVSLHNVMARGDRAYLAHYHDGIRVFDLSDPTRPTPLAYFNTWREQDAVATMYASAMGIDLDPLTRRIYVADTRRGLLVLSGDATVFP